MEQWLKKMIKATPSKKDIKKEVEKEVKKEVKTPSKSSRIPVGTATKSSIPVKKNTASRLREGLESVERVLEKNRKRRGQTEVERLRPISGWRIWDNPLKRKLKDDFDEGDD